MTQRYRSDITPTAPAVNLLVEVTPSGANTTKENIFVPNALTRICNDSVIPGFKKRSAAGEVFINDYNSSNSTYIGTDVYRAAYSQEGYNAVRTISAGGYLASSTISWATCPTPSLDIASMRNKAMIQCLGNVNKTDADAGAFIGEWSKTKVLHRDLLNGVLKLMSESAKVTSRRGRVRKVPVYDERGMPILNRKGVPLYRYITEPGSQSVQSSSHTTKNAANLWLSVRMGLTPLLMELENAIKSLCKKFSPRFTARGNGSVQAQTQGLSSVPVGDGSYDLIISITRTFESRFGILYETDSTSRMAAQFGLSRPLSSAWELLPWSFMVDWFVNVGAWLDAVQPAAFTKTLGAWESTRETVVTAVSVGQHRKTYVAPAGVSYDCSLSGGSIHTVVSKGRSLWVPSVPVFPSSGTGLSTLRSLDLASLMMQKIKTRF